MGKHIFSLPLKLSYRGKKEKMCMMLDKIRYGKDIFVVMACKETLAQVHP